MRKFVLAGAGLLLALTIAAAALWLPTRPRAYTPQGPGDIYLALGDSLAWGLRLDNPQTQSYPALIARELSDTRSIRFESLAIPGETSGSFVRRQLPRAVELIRAARAEGLRVSPITIDIGGNDLRNVERRPDDVRAAAVAEVQRNLAQILDELRRAAGPTADIAVMTYYNPYGGEASAVGSEAYWVAQLNLAIDASAAPRGVALADGYAALDGGRAYTHTFILLGDIHANAQGHRLLADAFVQALAYP